MIIFSTIVVTGVAGDKNLGYRIPMADDNAIVRILARGGDGGPGGAGGKNVYIYLVTF